MAGKSKMGLLLFIGLLLVPGLCPPCLALDSLRIPCEVMETSGALKSSSGRLNGVRYILIHQANAADRESLGKWLKAHSGTEVRFFFEQGKYKGILCRLAHCFGRGLLIFTADVRPEKRDIIEVVLPLGP